jgi:hypothetical protein
MNTISGNSLPKRSLTNAAGRLNGHAKTLQSKPYITERTDIQLTGGSSLGRAFPRPGIGCRRRPRSGSALHCARKQFEGEKQLYFVAREAMSRRQETTLWLPGAAHLTSTQ